jgi:hypothetical protein
MIALEKSLSEYGEVMLRAIAAQWQVEAEEAEALPARLAAAMLDEERLRAFVEGLEPEARAALARVAAAGGAIRGHLLTQAYGAVRRLGPKAIERERPWQQPASATERLWYAGLLYRRYGRLGGYHGEVFYIPKDLLASLPVQPGPPPALALRPVAAPGPGRDDGLALVLDLETLLARLRLAPVSASRTGGLPAEWLSLLSERWRGSNDPERLALLERLALRARLIVRRGGQMQVGSAARAWLQRPPFGRQSLLFRAWHDDPVWNELWRVPSLRCDATGWRNDPRLPRAAVLAALRRCPEGWLRLAELTAALKATEPDFARPDGDYDAWYIRDAATGQYLQGFAHWDAVEGALIAHLVTRSLYWLGVVALAGEPAQAFHVTATGRALLGQAAEPPPLASSRIRVGEDLSILVPPAASAYDRVRLERLARWAGREGESDLFRLDPEATWQALNAGISGRQIIAFLERASGRPLPGGAARAIRAQASAYGRVTLRRAVLLQTADAETLRLLRNDPELGQRLNATVSERAILVPEDQLPQVVARLKMLGFWPRLAGCLSPLPGQAPPPSPAPGRNRGRPPTGGSTGGGKTRSGS